VSTRIGTRQRLLKAAGDLFRRQGYNATGLSQILAEGQAPKGTLYHHFPGGKEQLGAESVAAGAAELGALIESVLNAAPDPQSALDQIAELFAAGLEGSGFREGCPVATVALEAAADSEPLRVVCAQAYQSWIDLLAAAFGRWGVSEVEREGLAVTALAAVEGALLLARVQRDVAPLRAVIKHVGALIATAN
jgi:TetR/AcrR family transcriptional repressor of lmrAB and yxaGH operons